MTLVSPQAHLDLQEGYYDEGQMVIVVMRCLFLIRR